MDKSCNFLVFSLACALLLTMYASPALALSAASSQQTITLTLERGSEHKFFLLVNNVNNQVTLQAAGDVKDWITFGESRDKDYIIHPTYFTTIVLVNVDVPADTDLREFTGEMVANGTKLSDLRIRVTLELSDAVAYSKLTGIDKEVRDLKEKVESMTATMTELRVQQATLEQQVSEKMQEISQYQKDLTTLEEENTQLVDTNTELEQNLAGMESKALDLEEANLQLNQVTSMLAGTQMPGMFFGGILLGIIAVTLALKRRSIVKNFRKKLGRQHKKEKKEESFRYSWKPE